MSEFPLIGSCKPRYYQDANETFKSADLDYGVYNKTPNIIICDPATNSVNG